MSFNKMSKTEIVMIVFAILFIIEEIITNIDYMFFIGAPILLVSLLLFIINVFKRSLNFSKHMSFSRKKQRMLSLTFSV